ncbi:hypothetical protein BHU09_03035 [Tannerella sp. oral taxon 808]|nr:hypothetical protein BHU09_03035 [Tannerella sp. oral taxon 808]
MRELEYKNYRGSIEYSEEDKCLFGQVQGIRSLILYEGQTLEELEADFRGAIDDYLELCERNHYTPERSEAVVA